MPKRSGAENPRLIFSFIFLKENSNCEGLKKDIILTNSL